LEAAAQEAAVPEDLRARREAVAAELGALAAGPGAAAGWAWGAADSEVAAAPAVGSASQVARSELHRAAVELVDLAARLLLEYPASVLREDPAAGLVALAARQMAAGPQRRAAS